jgi:uncharacterized membrane-anchored protein
MYKVIREDDREKRRERERERERERGTETAVRKRSRSGGGEGERKKERKKQQTTRTRINGLSYYFHYGYNEVLMARRSDESGDYVGTRGAPYERDRNGAREGAGEGRETNDRRRWTD